MKLSSVAKKTAYVVAIFIVIAAIIVSVTRLLTPLVDRYRPDFEKFASDLLETPVTMEKVHFSWFRYQPAIGFDQVTVFNKETQQPIIQIRKIRLIFSIPSSLWQRKWVPSGILISGSDINLHQSSTGEISVQGFPNLGGFKNQPYSDETKFKDILGWLSQQPRLVLQDIDVAFTAKTGEKHFISLYNLSFQNANTTHIILGKAMLHQRIPTDVTVSVQWQGNQPDLEQIKAKIYLYVTGVTLPQWLNGLSWNGWQIKQGIASAKIWATWNRGSVRKVQTNLQLYGLNIDSETGKSTYKINRLSGNFGWKRDGDGQILAGDDILIDLPQHLWPVTSFYVALAPDAQGQLYPKVATLGYVDLSDIQTLLPAFPSTLPDSLQQALKALQLKGNLQNATVTFANPWTDWNQTSIQANFSQISFLPWQSRPGINNLSGTVKWNGNQGHVQFNTNRAQLKYDTLFAKPIAIDQLTGEIDIQRDPTQAWVLQTSGVQVLNSDIAANVSGRFTIPQDSTSPLVDLTANMTMQKVNALTHYLPVRILDADLKDWLTQAFLAGEIKSANAVLRGKLSDFPFDHNNGLFTVTAGVKNIDLRYAPNWPLLRRINATLAFTGRKMTIDVDNAMIFDIPVANVHAIIPYFGEDAPQILQVDTGNIQLDFTRGLHFIHASPLEKNLGKMFDGLDLTGPITLNLGLTVPLSHPDNTTVKGLITLKNTQMKLAPWGLEINKLNGELNFTEKGTDTKKIQGLLFNKPLTFSLATVPTSKTTSYIQAKFATDLSILDLEQWLKIPFSNYTEGSSQVTGEIDLSLHAPLILRLKSDLQGISVKNLPDQFDKKAEESREFYTEISSQDKQPLRLRIRYAKLLNAALILDKKSGRHLSLTSAAIQLGEGTPAWPQSNGLYLSGDFDKLDWEQIKGYMGESSSSTNASSDIAGLKLREIDIRASIVELGGHSLNQVRLQVQPTPKNWNIDIASPDIVGQIQIPTTFTSQGLINAQFQKINLQSSSASGSALSAIQVKSLPSINFVANNVSYDGMPLGQVAFKTSPSSNGLTIRSFTINSSRLNLQAAGEWLQGDSGYLTHIKGNANSSRVSELLSSLGLDAKNFIVGRGSLNFDLSWRDAPYALSLASLSGKASLDLGSGRIVDIGQESGAKMDLGRMLSIFSLQTIPRRLSLDFSDVFQKGYSFDFVRGDFNFQNGDLRTQNLRFDGPVAGVGINGRIGLKNKDYDLILSVTPHVTSSIPIAAGLITMNPLVGLGAFAVNSVISSQVSKVSTYSYAVTGPWNNPTWTSNSSAK